MAFEDVLGTDSSAIIDELIQRQAPAEATAAPVDQRITVDRLTRRMMQPTPPAPVVPETPSREPSAKAFDPAEMGTPVPDFASLGTLVQPAQTQPSGRAHGELQGYEPPKKSRSWGDVASDIGKNLEIGKIGLVQGARELVDRIPNVGKQIGEKLDAIDRAFDQPVGKELKAGKEALEKSRSPQIQAASKKDWWDDEKGWFGDAWSDPLAYESTITQSMPEQVATMLPAMKLASLAYKMKIGMGATVEVASKTAARTATISGAVGEGMFGGAHSAIDVRDTINELKPEILAQSEAFNALLSSGMTPDDARKALAEDKATRAFVVAGVVTGMFGGMGDRAVAKILTERLGKKSLTSTLKATAGGALGEGVFEEFPQSAGQKLAENEAIRAADPTLPLTKGVLNEALGGLASGGVQGGAMGGATHLGRSNTPAPGLPPPGGVAGGTGTPPGGPTAGPGPGPTGPLNPPPGGGQSSSADINEFVRRAQEANPPQMPDSPDVARGKQTRDEIDEFIRQKEGGGNPTTPQDEAAKPPAPPTQDDLDYAVLRNGGYTDEQINSMDDEYRKRELDYFVNTMGLDPQQAIKNPNFKRPSTGTRADPIKATTAEDVKRAVPALPSPGQAAADNYRQAHMDVPSLGLTGRGNVSIETGKGGIRKGQDADGKAWEVTMPTAYGKIKGTKGADGEALDIFIGDHPEIDTVYVIDQNDPKTGKFDEHKIMAGMRSPIDALRTYDAAYSGGGRDRIGGITMLSRAQFDDWKTNGDHTKPLKGAEKSAAPNPNPETAGTPGTPEAAVSQTHEAPQVAGEPSSDASVGQPTQGETVASQTSDEAFDELGTMFGSKPDTPDVSGTSPDVSAPEREVAEHADEVEAVLGADADNVAPIDIQRAAEIMAETGIGPAEAFQQAVVENTAAQDYLDYEELLNAYGNQIEVILPEPAATSERGADDLAEGGEREAEQVTSVNQGADGVTEGSSETGSEGETDTTVEAGNEPDTERENDDAAGEQSDTGGETGRDADREQEVASKAIEAALDKIEEAVEAKDRAGVLAAAKAARKVLADTSDAIKDAEPDYWSQFGDTITKMSKVGYVTAKQEAEAEKRAKPKDGFGSLMAEFSIETDAGTVQVEVTQQLNPSSYEEINKKPGAIVGIALKGGPFPDGAARQGVIVGGAINDASLRAAAEEVIESIRAEVKPKGKTDDKSTKGNFKKTKVKVEDIKKDDPLGEIGEKKERLEDAGEKIGGARKDAWIGRGLTEADLEGMTGAEIARHVVKANVWERPDYVQAVEDGVDPAAAFLIKRVYDRIATKPQKGRYDNRSPEQLRADYIAILSAAREVFADVKTTQQAFDAAKAVENKIGWSKYREMVVSIRPANSRKDPLQLDSWGDDRVAKRAVEEGFPNIAPWQRLFKVYKSTFWSDVKGKDGNVIIPKGTVRYVVQRKNGGSISEHKDREEAEAAAKKAYDDLDRGRKDGGEEPKRPHLDRIDRSGPDYRHGKDVDADSFIKDFGFRGVEFGNWVAGDERQKVVNLAYDALHDLARVLGLPPKAISLDGTLAVAFGSRGRGGKAAAHYEGDRTVINMTKLSGAGALAHEWAHALDHYLGELDTKKPYGGAPRGISGWYTKQDYRGSGHFDYHLQNLPMRLRKEANRLMHALFYREQSDAEAKASLEARIKAAESSRDAWASHLEHKRKAVREGKGNTRSLAKPEYQVKIWNEQIDRLKAQQPRKAADIPSDFLKNAEALSGTTGDYWKRPTEMFARSFEAYVYDKLRAEDHQSQYLVQGVEPNRFGNGFKGNPYPAGEERKRITVLYDRFARALTTGKGKLGEGTRLEGSKEAPEPDPVFEVVEVEKPKPQESMEAEIEAVEESSATTLPAVFENAFIMGEKFASILQARKLAKDKGFGEDAKEIEEALEYAVVRVARRLITNEKPKEAFDLLVDLYERQPRLGTRTSTSVRDQAYSTPVPLAYVASQLAGIGADMTVYEPTAGNGALLIGTQGGVYANEINSDRAKNLRDQGYFVGNNDASEPFGGKLKSYDVVIANPPFGAVRQAGESKVFDLSDVVKGYETTEIDQAISFRALAAMKDGGRAVLILGGINKQASSQQARSDAYNGKSKRTFYYNLYNQYNVVDHFTVAGELYERQGAAWPVDVIVIEGRGKSKRKLPAADVPRVLSTWDEVGGLLDGLQSRAGSERDAGSADAGAADDAGRGGSAGPDRGDQLGAGPEQSGVPGDVGPAEVFEEPVSGGEPAGPIGDQAGVGPRSGGQPDRTGEPATPVGSPSGLTFDFDSAFGDAIDNAYGKDEKPQADADFDRGFKNAQADGEGSTRRRGGPQRERDGYDAAVSQRQDTRSTAQVAKDTAQSAVDSADAAFDALSKLFGGNKLSMGVSFDEEQYKKAKPLFTKAAEKFAEFRSNLGELLNRMVAHLRDTLKWPKEAMQKVGPYLKRFFEELQAEQAAEAAKPKAKAATPKQTETEQQVAYEPQSKVPGLNTLVPVNMRRSVEESLFALESRVGPIDEFVSKELKYTAGQLEKFFSAEQVDALGLAIDNIKNNKGFIIGDQTGIGKGRVNAAIIRWAIVNKRIPIFVTEKPGLYTDMYRDMMDIDIEANLLGGPPRILATNGGLSLPLDEKGTSIQTADTKEHNLHMAGMAAAASGSTANMGRVRALYDMAQADGSVVRRVIDRMNAGKSATEAMMGEIEMVGVFTKLSGNLETVTDDLQAAADWIKSGKEPTAKPSSFFDHYDMVFTNYSQMQTLKGEDTARRAFLERIAPNSVIIVDESHNAGGQAKTRKKKGAPDDRAKFTRNLIAASTGVFYSSATYAKRPDVMDLYSKTDMAMAVDDVADLAEAIQRGGVPMQQVVAAMLAKAGQYLRRERSFAGIEYSTPLVSVNREDYNEISRALAGIQALSKEVAKAAANINEQIKAEGEVVGADNATGDAGAHSTLFTSVMHNLINQMLLAMKVEPAAKAAIEAIQRGEKPVITVANTMESLLSDYAAEMGIKVGDKIDADFSEVLLKYLERTRTIIIKPPNAKKGESIRKRLTDAELGPAGVAAYNHARGIIKNIDLSEMAASPIDMLKWKIEQKGYRVGEITGRGMIIDYSGDDPILRSRGTKETSTRGKNETRNKFNGGDYDALVLNQSGSTGISLHSSVTFKDQKPRVMIIAQAEANIDTHMQMLGRVNRTGQVNLPRYMQLVADIPAEKRPASVLAKKMASLNANTTASRSSALTAKDVPDFMNQYGDQVAAAFIADNPELNERLGRPISISDETGKPTVEGAIRKLTGRLPLEELDNQEEIYRHLEDEYASLLQQLEASGENALEAKTFDFKARTLEYTEVVGEKNLSGSPFAAPVVVEKMSLRRLGKPFSPAEVMNKVLAALGSTLDTPNLNEGAIVNLLEDLESPRSIIGKLSFENESKRRTDAVFRFNDFEKASLAKIDDADKKLKEKLNFNLISQHFLDIHPIVRIGRRVTLKTVDGNIAAIVIGVEDLGRSKNPLAASNWKATFAIPDASRQMVVPFSRLRMDGKSDADSAMDIEVVPLERWIETSKYTLERFMVGANDVRVERMMATGNLLAAYDWLNHKGQILNYTDETGIIHQGILIPKDFDLAKYANQRGRVAEAEEIKTAFDKGDIGVITTKNGPQASIIREWNKNFTVQVHKAKKIGGVYYVDEALTKLTGDFYSHGAKSMTATGIGPDKLIAIIKRMKELGADFVLPAKKLETKKAEHKEPPKEEPLARVQEKPSVTANWSDRVLQTRPQIERLATEFLRSIVGPGVQIEFHEGLIPSEASLVPGWGSVRILGYKGQYLPVSRIITLALYGSPESFNNTMFHEAYHHVASWLMDDNTRKLIKAEIPRLRGIVKSYKNYDDAKTNTINDMEIEAIAAEAWFAGIQAGFHIGIRRWLIALQNGLRRIYNGLRGLGFRTAEDVFGDIKSGKFANAQERTEASDHPIDSVMGAVAPRPRRATPDVPETISEILFARGWGRLARIARSVGGNAINPTEVRTLLQDKFIRIRNAEQSVNPSLPVSQRTYQAEGLYYGRTGQRLENLERTQLDPLIDEIKARNLTLEDVDQFLYARHAAERNAYIASINPGMPDGGSGMTNDEAQDILDDIDNSGRRADYDAIETRVRDLIVTTRATLLNYGLISQETHDQWDAQYSNYVPLRGYAEGLDDEETLGAGMGFDTRAREAQRALGRASEAMSPLSYVMLQAELAIVRGEKNLVGNTFLRFVQNNPDPARWEVNRPKFKRTLDRRTGLVVNTVDREIKDNEFVTKVSGQRYIITLHGSAGLNLARALRKMGTSNVHWIVRIIGMLTRTVARISTQYNPEFALFVNPARDLGEALINLQGEDQRGRFTKLFAKHYLPAIGGSFQALAGRGTGRYAQAFREFDRAGGRVRFFGLENPDDIREGIEKRLRRLEGGLINNATHGLERAGDAWDVVVGAMENGTRLAAYMAARDLGMNISDAATLALNLTVNFTKKGEWGQIIAAFYAFGNATIQGVTRNLRGIAKSKWLRRALYTMATVAALVTAFNIGAGGDDDEGTSYYMKIPPWVRDKNFILMWPKGFGHDGKTLLQIPAPQGYALFHVIGSRLAGTYMGKDKPGDAVEAVMGALIHSFNFMGDDKSLAQYFPTIFRPAVHVAGNENWTGRQVYPANRNENKPDSQQYFRNASDFSKWAAERLNSATGGTPYEKGLIDVHPGSIDTFLQFLGGGLGRFVAGTIKTGFDIGSGEWEPAKTPILRRFHSNANTPEADAALYGQMDKEARDKASTVKDATYDRKVGKNIPESEKVLTEGAAKAKLFQRTDKELKQLRTTADAIKNSDLSAIDKKERITIIESRIRQLQNNARREAGQIGK